MGWDDPRATAPRKNKESLFLSLKEELKVRIIAAPEYFERHWVPSKAGKDVTIKCPGKATCQVCQIGENAARLRAIYPVLDRKTGKGKIMDVPQIIDGYIRALKDSDWGDPAGYDLTIKRIHVGKKIDYQVIPHSSTPLDPIAIEESRKFLETINYKKFATPHTAEEIAALLNGTPLPTKEGVSATATPPAPPASVPPAAVPQATPPAPQATPPAPQATPPAPQATPPAPPAAGAPEPPPPPADPPPAPQAAPPSYVPPAAPNPASTQQPASQAPGTPSGGPMTADNAAPGQVNDNVLNQFLPGQNNPNQSK